MSKSRKSVNSFANLKDLKGIQEVVCWNQQSEAHQKLSNTPINDKVDTKQQEEDKMWKNRRIQTSIKLSKKGLNQYRRFLDLPTR